jgi:hypothetical protein
MLNIGVMENESGLACLCDYPDGHRRDDVVRVECVTASRIAGCVSLSVRGAANPVLF